MGGLSPAFHKLSSTRSIWGQRLIELWSLSSWINLWLCETSGLTDGTAHYLRSICEVQVREGVCFFFLIRKKKILVRDGEVVDGNVFTGLWVATVVVKITLTTHDFSASKTVSPLTLWSSMRSCSKQGSKILFCSVPLLIFSTSVS